MKKHILSALLLSACFSANAAVVVIGNPQGVDNLSVAEVKNLYLGKTQQLPNGSNAQLFEIVEGSAERTEFHSKTTGRNDAQLQSNWSRLVFTGKAVAPEQVANSAAIIEAVKSTPNAVGYIDGSQITSDVKLLLTL